MREFIPGPGEYNPNRADTVTKAKSPATKMVKPQSAKARPARSVIDNTPGPGAYDRHLKKFGEGSTNVSISPIQKGANKEEDGPTDERSSWLQSQSGGTIKPVRQEKTPGPGTYIGNKTDFGKSAKNVYIEGGISRKDIKTRNFFNTIE